MRKRFMMKFSACMLALAVTLAFATPSQAAAKPKLSKTKLTLEVGAKAKLTVKNSSGSVKWSSNKKSVAAVSSKGTVKGIGAGTAVIRAKVKKTTLKCTVTVEPAQKVQSFTLYNSRAETYEVPTGCTTFSAYEIRQYLRTKGDVISSSAEWVSSDPSLLLVFPDEKSGAIKLRALGFGTVTLTVTFNNKTFVYTVDIVDTDPYAMTDDDMVIVNATMDNQHNCTVVSGASFNFMDYYRTTDAGSFSWSYLTPGYEDLETARGIKLGSTIGDVYAAYGMQYTRPYTTPGYGTDEHTVTKNIICHYGIREKSICYQLGLVFDQDDRVMWITYGPHLYHGAK